MKFFFLDTIFKAIAAIAQRLINGFRAGRQTALQLSKSKADVVLALTIEAISQVHLIAHILRHIVIQRRLLMRERVVCCIGAPFREQFGAVEFEQLFFNHAPHQVGYVDLVGTLSELTVKAVTIEQREPDLEVFFLAIVRGSGHQ
ncbi:hypothetical protein D3C76_1075850 [compost metagenome]